MIASNYLDFSKFVFLGIVKYSNHICPYSIEYSKDIVQCYSNTVMSSKLSIPFDSGKYNMSMMMRKTTSNITEIFNTLAHHTFVVRPLWFLFSIFLFVSHKYQGGPDHYSKY